MSVGQAVYYASRWYTSAKYWRHLPPRAFLNPHLSSNCFRFDLEGALLAHAFRVLALSGKRSFPSEDLACSTYGLPPVGQTGFGRLCFCLEVSISGLWVGLTLEEEAAGELWASFAREVFISRNFSKAAFPAWRSTAFATIVSSEQGDC